MVIFCIQFYDKTVTLYQSIIVLSFFPVCEGRAKQPAPAESDELLQKLAQRRQRIQKVDWNNWESSLKNNKQEQE